MRRGEESGQAPQFTWIVGVWVAIMVLGATGAVAQPTTSRDDGDLERWRPQWWAYEREPQFPHIAQAFTYVPMSDGAQLACEIARPAVTPGQPAPGRFPSIIHGFVPYAALVLLGEGRELARYGYNVASCQMRGTGLSGGVYPGCCAHPVERRDGAELVEWLARQKWSTDRIGMTGTSYGGLSTLATAALRPPSLRAILPAQQPHSLYQDFVYRGGIKTTLSEAWPAVVAGTSVGRVCGVCEEATWRQHPDFDDYWATNDYTALYGQIDVPVFTVLAAPEDNFFRRTMTPLTRIFASMNDAWVAVVPAAHGAWMGDEPHQMPFSATLAWWDHWLQNLPDAPLPPTTERFVAYEEPVGVGAGYRALKRWPPPDVVPEVLHLNLGNKLGPSAGPAGTGSFTSDPSATSVTGFTDGQHVTFTSPPLDEDVVLAGEVTVRLRAALDSDDGNFVVELFDVYPDGTEQRIQDGYLLGSKRESLTYSLPVPVGESVAFDFETHPMHYRLVEGHQLRVRLSGGPSDVVMPAKSHPVTTTVSLGEGGSTIELPTRRARRNAAPTTHPSPDGHGTPPAGPVGPSSNPVPAREEPALPSTGGGAWPSLGGTALLAVAAGRRRARDVRDPRSH